MAKKRSKKVARKTPRKAAKKTVKRASKKPTRKNSKTKKTVKRVSRRVAIPEPIIDDTELPPPPLFEDEPQTVKEAVVEQTSEPLPFEHNEPIDPPQALDFAPKKKGFLARLFSKGPSTPPPPDESNDLDGLASSLETQLHESDIQRSEKPEQTDELDQTHYRQHEHLTNMHRRQDTEIRERHEQLRELEQESEQRKAELEKFHDQLLRREQVLSEKEGEYAKMQQMQQDIEDQKITIQHEKNELTQLKEELAQREAQMKEQEKELHKKETDLQERENQVKHTADDDSGSLAKKYQKHITQQHLEQKEEQIIAIEPEQTHQSARKDVLSQKLQEAYKALSQMNITQAKDIYRTTVQLYTDYTKENGVDHQLYQDIVDLYKDIKQAMHAKF